MRKREFEHGVIYNGDCLDVMPDVIADHSIDMILADLPYETTDCHWDNIIPLDKYFDESDRVLKINGVAALFAQAPFTFKLGMAKPEEFRHNWVWIKDKAADALCAPYKPRKFTEDILIFSQSGFAHNANNKCTYNPQTIPIKKYTRVLHKSKRVGESMAAIRDRPKTSWKAMLKTFTKEYDSRFPGNYLYYPVPFGENRFHPTQKPVELFQYLIMTYTNKGDVVLDNVIGSGTTAIAAYNIGRKWIGIEKDPEIFDMACERIEKETRQQNLFN